MNVALVITANIVKLINKKLDQYRTASTNDSTNEVSPHLIEDVNNTSQDVNDKDSSQPR